MSLPVIRPATPQLSLQEFAALRTELIWIYDHKPGSLTMKTTRNRDRGNWVWFLRQGSLSIKYKRGVHNISLGNWILIPEGTSSHSFSEDARLLSIHFRCQWPSGENLFNSTDIRVFKGNTYPHLEKESKALDRCVQRNIPDVSSYKNYPTQLSDFEDFLQLQSLFLNWLRSWTGVMSREGISWSRLRSDDERILAATRLLNRLPLEAGFPGKALIQESHLSLVQLNRLFLLEFGLTSRKYWDKRRLQQALDTLQEADTPIKEIAYNLGFRSDSLFINWFRRRTGQSPGKHRELNHISRTV